MADVGIVQASLVSQFLLRRRPLTFIGTSFPRSFPRSDQKVPGGPGGCPPGLPRIRTCPIKAYGSSGHGFATGRDIPSRIRCRSQSRKCGECFASSAIRCCFVNTRSSSDALGMFPSRGHEAAPPSLPRVQVGPVPLLRRYYEVLRFPTARDAALRFLHATLTTPRASLRVSGQVRRRLGAGFFLGLAPPH